MNIEVARAFLIRCTIIKHVVLIVRFLVFLLAGDWLYRFHGRWFQFTRPQFAALHYGGMSVHKIGILLFNLVPLIALCFVR
jgi:hypothetical protein